MIKKSFSFPEFHVNSFTIFSWITTESTDVIKSLQCRGMFFKVMSPNFMLDANILAYTYSCDSIRR